MNLLRQFGNMLGGGAQPQAGQAPAQGIARPQGQFMNLMSGGLDAFAQSFAPEQYQAQQERQYVMQQRQIAMQEAQRQREAQERQRALDAQYGQVLGGGAMPPRPAQQAPQMPTGGVPQQQAPTGQPQQIAGPPPAQQAPAMVQMEDGSMRAPEVVEVTGQVRRPAPPAPNPLDMAARYEEASRQAYQNGDVTSAERFRGQAQTLRQQATTARQGNDQVLASLLAPIAANRPARGEDALEWDQSQQDAVRFALDDYARRTGRDIDPNLEDALLSSDARTRSMAIRQIIGSGSPKDATEQAIKTQGSYDEFQPLQRDDTGTHLATFNPRTGQWTQGPAKQVSPDVRFTQGAQTRREAMGNAVTMRGQDLQARTAANAQAIQRNAQKLQSAQGAQRLALQRQGLKLQQQRLGLAQDTAQWERSTGKTSGAIVDTEGWEDIQ
jgi:hypothetical protein